MLPPARTGSVQYGVTPYCTLRSFSPRQTGGERRQVEGGEAVVAQPAQIRREHVAQVGDAVLEHRDAVEPHAEGEALVLLGVEPAIAGNVGVHHAAAQDLE